jgi:hypothetical protein
MRLRHLLAALALTVLGGEGVLADPIRLVQDSESPVPVGADQSTGPDARLVTTGFSAVPQQVPAGADEFYALPGSLDDAGDPDDVVAVDVFSGISEGLASLTYGAVERLPLEKDRKSPKHSSYKLVRFKHKKHHEDPIPVPIPIPEPSSIATLVLGIAVIGLLGPLRRIGKRRRGPIDPPGTASVR